ncbi:hypothetical protein DOTSEDRAFT_75107 [Dothistroma septosporum NZE10]|uniref:Uncharacterized protein n=1 Tax=Dothistroma septosporum (strain NZE10 / CBS 128990) TaxID=675120 RepID=M2YK51_DOTSN|nr:hypothetical protein DOTSEDRAFT_75107 [Dothistroma septosporum NZE10]
MMEKLRQIRHRGQHEKHHVDVEVTPILDDNAAFNTDFSPASLDGTEVASRREKWRNKVEIVKHAIAHPHQSIKQNQQKALVKGFSVSERPWLNDQVKGDEQLWEAHNRLRVAKEHRQLRPNDNLLGVQVRNAERRVQQLEADRQQLEVAYHMGRYVHRARAVQYGLEYPRATSERYSESDPAALGKRFLWLKWLGHVMLYGVQDAATNYIDPSNEVPYDREVLLTTVERLLITTHTFQQWWMRVRRVYRWEDPTLTAKWLAAYFVLWWFNYCMTGFWVYLLYSMWSNRNGEVTRGWIHNSSVRARDHEEKAAMLSEMILRYGSDAWFEPFLDAIGPWLQGQVLDLAQFFEISNSYYEWRNVSANYGTTFAYVAVILISAVTSYDFSMKFFWLVLGVFFFMIRPVASWYPRFRHVVDPVRWFFWHQPTFSEYCFSYLRDHAQDAVQKYQSAQESGESDSLHSPQDDDNEVYFDCESSLSILPLEVTHLPESAILTVRAHWCSQRGTIELTRSSLRFIAHGGRTNTAWSRPLAHILEVCKQTIPLTSLPPKALPGVSKLANDTSALSIYWLSLNKAHLLRTTEEQPDNETVCEVETVYAMSKDPRDQLFNAILGISGKTWMELQPPRGMQTRSS